MCQVQVTNQLSNWSHLQGFAEKDKQHKEQQKEQYDQKSTEQLPANSDVWVNT